LEGVKTVPVGSFDRAAVDLEADSFASRGGPGATWRIPRGPRHQREHRGEAWLSYHFPIYTANEAPGARLHAGHVVVASVCGINRTMGGYFLYANWNH
jgi:hypothetical protein